MPVTPWGSVQYPREHWLLPLITYYLVMTGLLYKGITWQLLLSLEALPHEGASALD